MDIYLSNIDPSIPRRQILLAVAKVLQLPKFTQVSPALRFDVNLFRNRKVGGLSGRGMLTLPTAELGDLFLQEYGGSSPKTVVTLASKSIHFQKSRHAVPDDLLHRVCQMPELQVADLEADQEKGMPWLSSINFKVFQTGWECRDHSFSVEWEDTAVTFGDVVLDEELRELVVTCYGSDPQFGRVEKYRVVIPISHVGWLAFSSSASSEPAALIFLRFAPIFETINLLTEEYERVPALPYNDHAYVVRYASLVLRLTGFGCHDLAAFRRLVAESGIHFGTDHQYRVERRGLFSRAAYNSFCQWTKSLCWEVAFQVESLTRAHYLDITEILHLQPRIENTLERKGAAFTADVLYYLSARAMKIWFEEAQSSTEDILRGFDELCVALEKDREAFLPVQDVDFNCFHAFITPTRIRLEGPYPEKSNRVLRTYADHQDHFLRVTFTDEDGNKFRGGRDADAQEFVRRRFGGILHRGLIIAGRRFDFLAYSQSSLKEHSVWFVRPFRHETLRVVNAQNIIRSLGSFHNLQSDPRLMYCPARYGARISMAFTATESATMAEAEEIFFVDDIVHNGHCFTDGVGTVSPELAIAIWQDLGVGGQRANTTRTHPRAFQIRFMGSKGVVSVDYRLQGRAVCIRKSMIKFEAPKSQLLDIAHSFYKPGKFFLNRPLITILECLGVPYETFQKFQTKAVEDVWKAAESFERAGHLLEVHGLGTGFRLSYVLSNLQKLGVTAVQDAFYRKMLVHAVHHILRELKYRARIPLPGAYTLVGVADIHNTLEEGEIYACIRHPNKLSVKYLEGPVLITRSPMINPGDVQVVKAVGRPLPSTPYDIDPLYNTVVFSVKGSRPLCSYLGGGDLDGDEYNLIPLRDLPEFTPQETYEPADYKTVPRKELLVPSTLGSIADFVTEYVTSDIIGLIADRWLVTADQSEDGIFDDDCEDLAELYNRAVDYPKSGNPVEFREMPRRWNSLRPDWSAPETQVYDEERYYKSDKALGRLFRAITLPEVRRTPAAAPLGSRPMEESTSSRLMLEAIKKRVSAFIPASEPNHKHKSVSGRIFTRYVREFETACAALTLPSGRVTSLSEEEVVIGTVSARLSQNRQRGQLITRLKEQTKYIVDGVRDQLLGYASSGPRERLELCWATYNLARLHRGRFGAKSLGWVLLGLTFDVIKELEEEALLQALHV
ncbi:hypothetical protein HYDPIDRAFT_81362 [Hydnomerulius pinastri MD-312]|nr:hypothetical protein HYDPIDRAFT_81362 [Hydnomerulius pinastri MD-312]